jgi:poly(beta-D-mannuronate) lyase
MHLLQELFFIIPNGTYNNFSSSFTANANAANPITIKAETVGGVTLTCDSKFVFNQAAHIV